MIEVQHISKKFGDRVVLNDVSMTFIQGNTNLVIGGSGNGKTVLMKCMIGLLEVDQGNILYDQRNFTVMDFKERKPVRQEIGMVFQGGALFDSMDVEENVIFPMSMFTSWSDAEKVERANFCLQKVNLPNANRLKISELSGGMRKRVAIARAIALKPKYLFCDEPNSGLDPKTSHVIDELLKEITDEFQITTIINTHDMNSVVEIGERIFFINKGQKAWEGSLDDVLQTDNQDLNDFIFSSKLMKGLRK
jgi:phospholipid/cholesterol/gamma-HCH transport system ATP-binding protein